MKYKFFCHNLQAFLDGKVINDMYCQSNINFIWLFIMHVVAKLIFSAWDACNGFPQLRCQAGKFFPDGA